MALGRTSLEQLLYEDTNDTNPMILDKRDNFLDAFPFLYS